MEDFHQHIPRPDAVTRVTWTPWTELDPSTRDVVSVADIRAAFDGASLDGTNRDDANLDNAKLDYAGNDGSGPARAVAAVLVGIVDRAEGAQLLLIRRALDLDRDPGLIALPGGYVEQGERPMEAALREAEEEIGLARHHVELLSCLGIFERLRTTIPVVAYLGIVNPTCDLVASRDEVHEIFEVPLSAMLANGAWWREEWEREGLSRTVSFFADRQVLGNNLVWGLTAAIVWQLLERLSEALSTR